ncbi:EAL domain-containing protein [Geomonas oryzae]|uniref:EAL domain-containing protein n=1 Tax=Geomonas oryzae TaxID=2364273 RepID=UPI00100A4E22|nr:EAL domain-containing protein [Geomonas oryzae]
MQLWLKLLLSYLAVICATLLLAVGGISGALRVKESFNKVNREVIPHLLALKDLRYAGLRIVSSSMEYAFLTSVQGVDQENARMEEIRLIAEGRERFQVSLAICRTMLAQGKEQQPLEQTGQALLAASSEYLAVVRVGASARQLLASKERFENAEQEFLKEVNSAHDREMANLGRHTAATFDSVSSAVTRFVVVSLVAISGALILGVALSLSISRRIRLLKDAASQVAAGRRDIVLPVTAHDEIASVSLCFNGMVERLRDYEAELDAANSYLDSVITTMPEALTVVSVDGSILDVNRATELMFGYPREELVGRQFADLFLERNRGDALVATVTASTGLVEEEAMLSARDGRELHVSLSATMLDLKGKRERFLCLSHDVTKRKQAEQEVHNLAYFDQLTGLANRTLFYDRSSQALARCRRYGESFAILFFDLDHFKDVNDTMGHHAGDLLLQLVVSRIGGIVRASDTFARLGGDEFAILCASVAGPDGAATLAEKLLALMKDPFEVDGRQIYTGASIGIVLFPDDGSDIATLLKNADLAMYAAKGGGGNQYQFFSETLNMKAQERASIERALREALEKEQVSVHYQPQIQLKTGKVVAMEALARWYDEKLGAVAPARFIPVAEQTGLIRELGAWVLKTACAQCKQWHLNGHPLVISVNVSIKQVMQEDFSEMVVDTLLETGLEPKYLDLELTESMLMDNAAESVALLRMFKSLGVKISIDDFGTGYSSLSYLKNFSVDRIKIDQSFVRDITIREDAAGIVKAIVAIGHSMGVTVIAEGVESEEEEAKLRACRCDEVQGYLYARPMPAAEAEAFLVADREVPSSDSLYLDESEVGGG